MANSLGATNSRWQPSFALLLEKCLNISDQDELLVLYDESVYPYFEALEAVVCQLAIPCAFVNLPTAYQLMLMDHQEGKPGDRAVRLPWCVKQGIEAATAILNILNGRRETTPVRRAIIQQPRRAECRLAHIPGISPDILAVIGTSPIEEIHVACEMLAWVLGEAHHATVTTRDSGGGEHRLEMDLSGWDDEPMMSPGQILPGTWGNIPPGETFCCPAETSVNGSVCIDGSVPGHVLQVGEEVILTFSGGKLTAWSGKPSPALHFFDAEQSKASTRQDGSWNTFAELGIGLNPAVTQLTGQPLFDEKASETLHIAIGDNTVFGRNTKSDVHHDLVIRRPSLTVDDHVIMDHGQLLTSAMAQWRATREISDCLPSDAVIKINEARLTSADGMLTRQLSAGHRKGHVTIADPRMSSLLSQLYDELRTYGGITVREFASKHTFGDADTLDLLNLLNHYKALRVTLKPPA